MKMVWLTAAALLFAAAANGQVVQQRAGFDSVVRALATHIPEINDEYEGQNEESDNYLWYYTQGMDEYGLEAYKKLQIYRYERPAEASDMVVVSFFNEWEERSHPGLQWFEYNRKTGALSAARQPFTFPSPVAFNKELEADNYWRFDYNILPDGCIVIDAHPDMNSVCIATLCWNKTNGNFTFFKRGVFTPILTVGQDNAQTEEYVRNVIRPNYQRINNTTKWTAIEEKENFTLSLEGALITYYYSGNELQKMVAKLNGESYRCVIEYYLLEGRLSFIHDITQYITPNYTEMTHTIDSTVERRWYIKDNACFRGLGDNGQKLTPTQIEEEFFGAEDREMLLYISLLRL